MNQMKMILKNYSFGVESVVQETTTTSLLPLSTLKDMNSQKKSFTGVIKPME